MDTSSDDIIDNLEDDNCEDTKHEEVTTVSTKRCKNKLCIKSNIQSEDGLLVCINCGQLFSRESQLRDDPTQALTINCRSDESKSYVSSNRRFPNRFPTHKKIATNLVNVLVSNLSLGSNIRDQSVTIYKELVADVFRCASKSTKSILAAICVYLTLLKEHNPVTIGHMCNTIGCASSDFNKVYNQVITKFPQHRPQQMSIESLVPVTLSEATFDSTERKILEEKVCKILQLLRECWLIEGRTPCHIIYAASYLAWKSIKQYERRKVKLTDYCRLIGIEYKHTTSERVTELVKAIERLATHLPKHKRNVNKYNISTVLDEVLTYQSSLVFDYNQQIKQNLAANGMTFGKEDNPNVKSNEWCDVFKRKIRLPNTSETNSQKISFDSNKSDEEISDTEIESYLRTDKEVKVIKKLKKYSENNEI
ncbi:transcription factor IIIB 50 kDa subunit-like [Oppia nitens]|uniref:transcription factor IIIB 50 kDa subunit-like n=1 Tax=Oppia nitens TaxID=1686743 RepID=UPI0023DAB722|nr:transcription factor IIIB 50 kDa subunit-like [Oppia nitens]